MAVHKWKVQPSEFWQMRPRHFWYLHEIEVTEQKNQPTRPGKLTSAEVARLKRLME